MYVPIASSDLVLSVRRNVQSEVWNNRYDLNPAERPDRPFGADWSSNLAANIHFVYQDPQVGVSLRQQADYAYVTDEDGSSYRFVIVYPPGDNSHVEFFPLPNAYTEQEGYYTSLVDQGNGRYGTQTVDPGGLALQTQYAYDLNNNKSSVRDPRTYTTTFLYDGRNQLYEVDYPVAAGTPAQNKTFGYDANGNKTGEKDENGHTTGATAT